MLELGKLAGTKLVEMPREILTDSVPGKVYHLTIKTEGIFCEEEVAEVLVKELYDRFKAKVIWIRIEGSVIDLQLVGSPFAWAALIPFLPALLALLGVTIILISIYNVLVSIPAWTWALLAVGIGLIFFGPRIAESVFGGYEAYEVRKG